jgi:ketosteroid isomerase-like protein
MTLKEMEKRLKALEDVEEVKQLQYAYIYALNARKFDDIIEMFSDDMREDGFPKGESRAGKKEVEKVWRTMDETSRDRPYLHTTIVAQPMVSVDGDNAKGYFLWLGRINDPRKFVSQEDGDDVIMALPRLGRYDMEYKKEKGKWKMSYLKFTLPWPEVKKLK